MRKSKPGRLCEHFPGASITPEAADFGRAMETFKRVHHRPHPDCKDVLDVLRSLGYRKVPTPECKP